jgi:serine-type D-Ala-D-Ala endopeptidase (penicillin-binding protein 7)
MKRLLIAVGVSLLLSGSAFAGKQRKQVPAPAFSAKSFLVADSEGMVLKEQDGDTVRPIASISKLMVGMLASEQDLAEQLYIPTQRSVQSSIPRNTATLSRRELLTLALVRSDNFAAQILCSNLPNCVDAMNNRAQELGMLNTHFNEPTGLDSGNVSTAHDLLKLMLVASSNSTVTELSSMSKAEIETNGKAIKVNNTNPLTSKFNITLSKTGFTNPAGGCLVMIVNSSVGQRIMILLGSRNAKTRIPDMEKLVAGL